MDRCVVIDGVSHGFRFGYGALMLAEEVLGRPWGDVRSFRADFVLMFCCFVNADTDFPYGFDDLVELCDADHGLLVVMREELQRQMSRWGGSGDGDKKKG